MVVSDEHESDAEFERTLLRSARRDDLAPETLERAWTRFASTVTMMAAQTSGAGSGARDGWSHRMVRAKWFFLGAIGGTVVTLSSLGLVMSAGARASASLPHEIRIVTIEGVASAPAPSSAKGPSSSPLVAPANTVDIAETTPTTPAKIVAIAHPAPWPPSTSSAVPNAAPSTLAAEIAALDAARTLLVQGSPDDALLAVERYHQDFPSGTLTPEARVLTLDALAAKGDHARVAIEATRFLARYPDAPQCAHVRNLLAASTSP